MIYRVYTDGACSNNPGPGGYGAVMLQIKNGTSSELGKLSGFKNYTTNNEMELTAVLKALRCLVKNKVHETKHHRIEILTDSSYIVNSINQGWYINWKNNNWKTKEKSEVKNKDLWIEICDLIKMLNVSIIKVKGHSGDKYNDMADKLAKGEIQKNK